METALMNDNAIKPTRTSKESAGLDLYSSIDVDIEVGSIKKVNTGICISLPENSYGSIRDNDNIDFLYGFIYECAILINNLYDYNYYDHLDIKLCSEFIMPIINITKKEHMKEYNEHIKNIIDNLESTEDIRIICLYLMKNCCKEYYELPQDEYLEIKEFIDNNIDIIESAPAPMNDYFDSCKK